MAKVDDRVKEILSMNQLTINIITFEPPVTTSNFGTTMIQNTEGNDDIINHNQILDYDDDEHYCNNNIDTNSIDEEGILVANEEQINDIFQKHQNKIIKHQQQQHHYY